MESANELVEANFRLLNRKCFYTNDKKLLIARYFDEKKDENLSTFIKENVFIKKLLI